MIRFAILTSSDRSARGARDDLSRPALAELVRTWGGSVVKEAVLPDDRAALAGRLAEWADSGEVDVILVTGGTGFGPRDVTPEATTDVIQREAPGLAEAMRAASLSKTPHAMLSRSVVGIRSTTLIINLPGSPKGAVENLQVILPVLEHAVHLLRGEDAGH
ncbi:MAG TPA: MogA/MoaB family molybdenum cofactor biosynthesis protein [Anaerolineales bacterium]|jgi:molybdenum cofactor synthesis domain-containing protein